MKFTDEDLQKLLDQNLSKAEIAQKLGVTRETIRYRTHQLRTKQPAIDPEVLQLQTETDKIDCKSALTLQEQIFLNLHLVEHQGIKDAMVDAGYNDLPERTIYFRAKKILQKYEGDEADKAKIMRMIGCGEVAVISRLWAEAQEAVSAVARVQALTTLGKWLGLGKETVEGTQGITVIIKAPDHSGPCLPSGPGPARLPAPASLPEPAEENRHPKSTRPGQPVQIVR